MTRTQADRLGDNGEINKNQPSTKHLKNGSLPDAAGDAIAQWKQAMRARVAEYFQSLRDQGVAPVHFHKVKGRSFIDLSIEGMRFKGQVRKGPVIVAEGGDCPLSSASITHSADYLHPNGAPQWAICNYRTQRRILLSALSLAGIRALACEFGLVIHGEGASDMVSESECFVNSLAFVQLQAWITRYPPLANKLLLDFPEFLGSVQVSAAPGPRSRYRRLREFQYLVG